MIVWKNITAKILKLSRPFYNCEKSNFNVSYNGLKLERVIHNKIENRMKIFQQSLYYFSIGYSSYLEYVQSSQFTLNWGYILSTEKLHKIPANLQLRSKDGVVCSCFKSKNIMFISAHWRLCTRVIPCEMISEIQFWIKLENPFMWNFPPQIFHRCH